MHQEVALRGKTSSVIWKMAWEEQLKASLPPILTKLSHNHCQQSQLQHHWQCGLSLITVDDTIEAAAYSH